MVAAPFESVHKPDVAVVAAHADDFVDNAEAGGRPHLAHWSKSCLRPVSF